MIDVIIPAYNCASTLTRTLGSLVAQTDPDFKVTIVDDCSTQDVMPIIKNYENNLDISYIRNEHNLGCGMSRQVGIEHSSNQHFCFLDSDDTFMPYTVETFNSIIEACPDTEYVHSYFYEQILVNDSPALILRKDGFMWCHGKLYNRDLIYKYGIKNSPLVRWADDSYFNSMCSELLEMQLVRLPMYLWCNNNDSIVRRKDPERDNAVRWDFLNAMKMSVEFVLQYRDYVKHLDMTMSKMFTNDKDSYREEERILIDDLMRHVKE